MREIMEEEINNFIMVWSSAFISACYCYGISKLIPKGTFRFFMFLPVLCLFVLLPTYLNSVNLIVPTAFFLTWLTSFKLLLLVFGTGPLSHTSLSFFHFLIIFCFPILLHPKEQHPNANTNIYKSVLKPLINNVKKGLVLLLLIGLGPYKDKFPRHIYLFLISMYVYIGLEVMLGLIAILGQVLLGTDVEPPFKEPYLSTSLQDFWGRRWNRVASNSLRSIVYNPISRAMGPKWASTLALPATFVVSDLMHEIVFYYVGRVRLGRGTLLFFLGQGICVISEAKLKKKIGANWRLPNIIMGPFVFGFAVFTFMWLALPELLEHNVDGRAIEEYAVLARFLKDLGLAWIKLAYNLLICTPKL